MMSCFFETLLILKNNPGLNLMTFPQNNCYQVLMKIFLPFFILFSVFKNYNEKQIRTQITLYKYKYISFK